MAAIVISVIGLAGLGFQPVMVSALIDLGDFDTRFAGFAASAEVFGIALANVVSLLLPSRVNWQMLCIMGLALMIVGCVGAIAAGAWPAAFLAARFVSGLGSGLLISRGYAAAGISANPDRMLGYVLAVSTAHVALGTLILPVLATNWGLPVLFSYSGLLALAGLAFVRWIPIRADPVILVQHRGSTLTERITVLCAAGLLFIALGVLWAYLFQIGLQMGATAQEAALGLTVSQIAAFGGALLAAFAGRLMPALTMFLLGIALTIGSIVLFPFLVGGLAYALLASGFNGGSNAAMVLILGAVAEADVDGRWIAAAVTAQTLGFAFGPALAALLMADESFLIPEILSAGLLVGSAVAGAIAASIARSRRLRSMPDC